MSLKRQDELKPVFLFCITLVNGDIDRCHAISYNFKLSILTIPQSEFISNRESINVILLQTARQFEGGYDLCVSFVIIPRHGIASAKQQGGRLGYLYKVSLRLTRIRVTRIRIYAVALLRLTSQSIYSTVKT
jgi:hypothetical protein